MPSPTSVAGGGISVIRCVLPKEGHVSLLVSAAFLFAPFSPCPRAGIIQKIRNKESVLGEIIPIIDELNIIETTDRKSVV